MRTVSQEIEGTTIAWQGMTCHRIQHPSVTVINDKSGVRSGGDSEEIVQ